MGKKRETIRNAEKEQRDAASSALDKQILAEKEKRDAEAPEAEDTEANRKRKSRKRC